MGKGQSDSVFVFDEPTIGLHPLDVQTLLSVFDALVDNGATVLVIEHNLDVIKCADYIIDLGPEGGVGGGTVVACGTPEEIANNPQVISAYLGSDNNDDADGDSTTKAEPEPSIAKTLTEGAR